MNKYNIKRYFKVFIINITIPLIIVYGIINFLKNNYEIFNSNYISYMFLLTIILLIVIYYISILIHEFGHALMLKILKIKIKVFNVGPIQYINNGKHNKISFNKKNWLFSEGFVVPKVNEEIYDEESFNKFIKKYILFIYGGISITLGIIIISSLFIFLSKLLLINILILIVNWMILLKAFNDENLRCGDFYTINILKNQPDYIAIIVQNNIALEFQLNSFLLKKIEDVLNKLIHKGEYDELILGLVDKILDEYIIKDKELSVDLKKLKEWVFNNLTCRNDNKFILNIVIIKVAYKFLLQEYSLEKINNFQCDYNKLNNYLLNNEKFEKIEVVNSIIKTLNFLKDNGDLSKVNFKYIISDLELIVNKCDNLNKKRALIVNKLRKC